MNKINQKFIEYLESTGNLKRFSKNLSAQKGRTIEEYMNDKKPLAAKTAILGAFDFGKTPEGSDYWMDVAEGFLKWAGFKKDIIVFTDIEGFMLFINEARTNTTIAGSNIVQGNKIIATYRSYNIV